MGNFKVDRQEEADACGSVAELVGTLGLFYLVLIALGFILITLGQNASARGICADFGFPGAKPAWHAQGGLRG